MAAKGSGRIPWVYTLDSQRVKSVLAQINVQLTLPTFNVIDNDPLLGIILYKPVNSCIKRRHESFHVFYLKVSFNYPIVSLYIYI